MRLLSCYGIPSSCGRGTRWAAFCIYALASSVVLTALVAINVVQRTTPAVTSMLSDIIDRASVTAQFHTALAAARLPEPAPSAARQRFDDALAQAARGASPAGQYLLSELEGLRGAALRGDQHALELTFLTISRLEASNRSVIEEATANFRRLGLNGAWALALLGMTGVVAGALIQRRLYRRVVAPLNELERVLLSLRPVARVRAARHHSLLARCVGRHPSADRRATEPALREPGDARVTIERRSVAGFARRTHLGRIQEGQWRMSTT